MPLLPTRDEIQALLGLRLDLAAIFQSVLRRSGMKRPPSRKTIQRWMRGETRPRGRLAEEVDAALDRGPPGHDWELFRAVANYALPKDGPSEIYWWRCPVDAWDGACQEVGQDGSLWAALRELVELDEGLMAWLGDERARQWCPDYQHTVPKRLDALAADFGLYAALPARAQPNLPGNDAAAVRVVGLKLLLHLYVIALFERATLVAMADLIAGDDPLGSSIVRLLPIIESERLQLPVGRAIDRIIERSDADTRSVFVERYLPSRGEADPLGSSLRKLDYWRRGEKIPAPAVVYRLLQRVFRERNPMALRFNVGYFLAVAYLTRLFRSLQDAAFDGRRLLQDEEIVALFQCYTQLYELAGQRIVRADAAALPPTGTAS
jgi:hypothetical protein